MTGYRKSIIYGALLFTVTNLTSIIAVSNCPTSCISCTSEINCTKCVEGNYSTNDFDDCRYRCANNCISCSSVSYCNTCRDGYFNGKHHESVYNKCELDCQPKCKSCYSFSNCKECNEGYYGPFCQYNCSIGCTVNVCEKANGSCRCKPGFSGAKCDKCITGKYDIDCSANCSNVCENGDCTDNGICSCYANYSGNLCNRCVDRKYGTNCQLMCPQNCASGVCTRHDGYCEGECVEGLTGKTCTMDCMTNETCKSCAKGNAKSCTACTEGCYGKYSNSTYFHCSLSCSENCINKTCNGETGKCDYSCIDGYYGDECSSSCHKNCTKCDVSGNCTTCKVGLYGTQCQKKCSDHDNNCLECINFNKGHFKCMTCKTGYYSSNSMGTCLTCQKECKNGTCDVMSGNCLDGCSGSFWGDLCNNSCVSGCFNCNRDNGMCNVCEYGKYGRDCSLNCSENCKKTSTERTSCHMDNGTCKYGCLNETFYGSMCNLVCNENCLNRSCDTVNGTCSLGCVTNKYGSRCKYECGNCSVSDTMISKCHDNNGTCLLGCEPGYYGDRCDRKCSVHCMNVTCDRSSGNCHNGCKGNFTDAKCVQVTMTDIRPGFRDGGAKKGSTTGATVGGSVGGVILVSVVVTLVFLLRRRNNKNIQYGNMKEKTHNDKTPSVQPPGNGNSTSHKGQPNLPQKTDLQTLHIANPSFEHQIQSNFRLSNVSESSNIELTGDEKKDVYPEVRPTVAENTYFNIVRRIEVARLDEYVAKKTTADFKEEFSEFPNGLVHGKSYAVSQTPENMARNRYRFVYPYDDYRVKLVGLGSDYINASYLDGYYKTNEYIACLGPTEKTTDDFATFWKMVWQQNVEKIAMVTNLMEGGSNKCDKYWPDVGTDEMYGDVTVTCHSEDTYADYTVRSFTVAQTTRRRPLYHIHYTAWPDKGVPDDVTSLIEFRQKVKSTLTSLNGPTLVHCSAGVGRTGTFVALDILTNQGEGDKVVDIFGCVAHMREHRVNMVQTLEQYEYLHHAVVHSLTFDCQVITSDKFQQYTTSLSDEELTKKFEQLESTAEKKIESEIEAVKRNKTQTRANRGGADIPGDRHRVALYLKRKAGSPGYINAVYIDGFRTKNRYIVAQTPLPDTVEEFMRLVCQSNCSCIVSLESEEVLKQMTVGTFFPDDNQVLKIGRLTVRSVKYKTTPQYTHHKITIHGGQGSSSERTVDHLQYTQWKQNETVPKDPGTFLQLISDVETMSNTSEHNKHIIIHCLTGGERSGLFCAVSVLIHKMDVEHEVSVVNTVRKVKSRRANAIPNKEQYAFCYQCVSAYVQSFDTYSNFALRT